MSDSCVFSMNILKKDRDRVTGIMSGGLWTKFSWPEEKDNGDGTVTLIEYDANYGYLDQRKELAKAGIVFEGYHYSGGTYSEAVFACYGSYHIDVVAVESTPVAPIDKNGEPERASVKAAKEYYRILALAENYFSKKRNKEKIL